MITHQLIGPQFGPQFDPFPIPHNNTIQSKCVFMKGVAAGSVKKALYWSCEKTVRCSTPLKSNKNHQAAWIAIYFQIDLNGKPVTKKSQFKERVSKNFLYWDREKKYKQLSMGYHIKCPAAKTYWIVQNMECVLAATSGSGLNQPRIRHKLNNQ
jgi:hypothetical protein